MKNQNIFVTHNNNQKFHPARRFLQGNGRIYHFTEGRKNIFHFDMLIREIKQVFKNMNPHDYLLISGNAVISSIVMSLVYSEFKKVNVLVWDYNAKEYVHQVLEFEE